MAYETTTGQGTRGTRPPHRRGTGGIWMAVIGAAVVIAGIWLIWAWWDTDEEVVEDEYAAVDDEGFYQDEPAGAGGATVEAISENPAQYAGQSVTVTGEIGERVSDSAVRLQGNDPAMAASLLVLDNRGQPITVGEDEQVRVTGNVQMFQMAQAESQLGIDLDDARFGQYEGQPVLMATSVQTAAQAREGDLEDPDEMTP
jgi:hypothetical protein